MAIVNNTIYRRELTYDRDGDTWRSLSEGEITAAIKSKAPTKNMKFDEQTLKQYTSCLGNIESDGITYWLHTKDNPGMGADYFCITKREYDDKKDITAKETKTDHEVTGLIDEIISLMMSEAEN